MDFHVIDDNPTVREMLSTILKHGGYSVEAYGDGLAYIEQMQAADYVAPKAIITDVQMPEIDGYELIERVRARNPEQKFVIITGFAKEERKDEFDCLHFRKPFRPRQLLEAVSALISEQA